MKGREKSNQYYFKIDRFEYPLRGHCGFKSNSGNCKYHSSKQKGIRCRYILCCHKCSLDCKNKEEYKICPRNATIKLTAHAKRRFLQRYSNMTPWEEVDDLVRNRIRKIGRRIKEKGDGCYLWDLGDFEAVIEEAGFIKTVITIY